MRSYQYSDAPGDDWSPFFKIAYFALSNPFTPLLFQYSYWLPSAFIHLALPHLGS